MWPLGSGVPTVPRASLDHSADHRPALPSLSVVHSDPGLICIRCICESPNTASPTRSLILQLPPGARPPAEF